jgi:hypothetical protein
MPVARIDIDSEDGPWDAPSLHLRYDANSQGHIIHKVVYGPYATMLTVAIAFVPDAAPQYVHDIVNELAGHGTRENRHFEGTPRGAGNSIIHIRDGGRVRELLDSLDGAMDEYNYDRNRDRITVPQRRPSIDTPISLGSDL